MDRKKFQNMFSEMDEFLLASLCDDIELCENIDYPVYTKYFFPPQLCRKLSTMVMGNLHFKMCGLNENCEKNMIGIYPKEYAEILEFPVRYFKITNMSRFKELEHRDYLGTLMGLGLKRELLGDLVVKDECCYGVAGEEIYGYIAENLQNVGKNPVHIEEISREEVPATEYEEIVATVPSMRFDNIVSAVSNLSRTRSMDLIETGNIQLNYVPEKRKSAEVKTGDIITVRKYGKYLVYREIGESKKGKLKVVIRKFI